MPQSLEEFVRTQAPGPFVGELERLMRIETAARWFVDRVDAHRADLVEVARCRHCAWGLAILRKEVR